LITQLRRAIYTRDGTIERLPYIPRLRSADKEIIGQDALLLT